jgi:hypothetical protein
VTAGSSKVGERESLDPKPATPADTQTRAAANPTDSQPSSPRIKITNRKQKFETWKIIVIVVCGFVGSACITGLVIFVCQRSRRQQQPQEPVVIVHKAANISDMESREDDFRCGQHR